MTPFRGTPPSSQPLSLAELLELLTVEFDDHGILESEDWIRKFPGWDRAIEGLCSLLRELSELGRSSINDPLESPHKAHNGHPRGLLGAASLFVEPNDRGLAGDDGEQ